MTRRAASDPGPQYAGAPAARAVGLLAPIALVLALASPAQAADWGIEQLMDRLRQVKSVKATFVERKRLAILNAPLNSSGTLLYSAPGRLEKHTLRPKPEHMTLEKDRLTVHGGDPGKSRTINLRQYPVAWAFAESIRSTLAGDLSTLKRFYDMKLSGDEGNWKLFLYPGEQAMQDVVKEIRIVGGGQHVRSLEVLEANGDSSIMTISEDPS